MVGFGGGKEEEPSDELNVGPDGGERNWCRCLGVETKHLGEWGRWREKRHVRVLFGAYHLCNDWMSLFFDKTKWLFSMMTLSFTVELAFLLLCWETFSLKVPDWGHQWCHREVPPGDVNSATCLHLGLKCLWLLTPFVGTAGLELRGLRDMHPPASELGIVLCAPITPGVDLIFWSRASDYQLVFNSANHHK